MSDNDKIIEAIKNWKARCSKLGEIIIEKSELTAAQKRDLEFLSSKPKLTVLQHEKLTYLTEKRDAQPELSESAKKELDSIYNEIVTGVSETVISKYYERGIVSEPDSLEFAKQTLHPNLYPVVPHGVKYENEWITGSPDIRDDTNPISQITDLKSAWSMSTLSKATFNKIYLWQGRGYLYLTGLRKFGLLYVLVDLPDYLVKRECEYHFAQNSHIYVDMSNKDYIKWCEEYYENTRYSKYPLYKRFRFWKDEWDDSYKDSIIYTVKKAREYMLSLHAKNMEIYNQNYGLMSFVNPKEYPPIN